MRKKYKERGKKSKGKGYRERGKQRKGKGHRERGKQCGQSKQLTNIIIIIIINLMYSTNYTVLSYYAPKDGQGRQKAKKTDSEGRKL